MASMPGIAPGEGEFLVRNHLSDLATMVVVVAFVLDRELKLKTRLRFEFAQFEKPAVQPEWRLN